MVKSWFVPNKSPVLGLGRCQERLLRLLTFLLHLEKAHPQPQSARLHRCKQDIWRCIVVGATNEGINLHLFEHFCFDCIPNMIKHQVGMENKEQDIKGWLILIHRQPMQEMIRDVLRERCVFAECSKGFWNKCFDLKEARRHRFFVMPICELRSDWAYTPAGSELRHLKVHGDGWPHLRGRSNLGRKSSVRRGYEHVRLEPSKSKFESIWILLSCLNLFVHNKLDRLECCMSDNYWHFALFLLLRKNQLNWFLPVLGLCPDSSRKRGMHWKETRSRKTYAIRGFSACQRIPGAWSNLQHMLNFSAPATGWNIGSSCFNWWWDVLGISLGIYIYNIHIYTHSFTVYHNIIIS